MKTQTQSTLEGNFNWQGPEITTSFVQGQEAEAVYQALGDYITQLGGISYDSQTETLAGSTPFLSARINALISSLGLRTANLRDLSRPDVMNMVRGKYYADAPVLVLRTMKDTYERNLPLIKRVAEEVEQANGKLELPVMIAGFDIKPWPEDEKGYGIDIKLRDDFTAIHDKRLDRKHNEGKFSEVDDLGLPKFNKNGTRTWHARDEGLSRLFLYLDLGLYSGNRDLANSDSDSRVVLVSAEGASKFFLEKFQKRRERFETQKREYIDGLQRLREDIDRSLEGLIAI